MATYEDLYGIYASADSRDLENKIAVAVAIKAQAFIDGATPTADELTWSNNALSNSQSMAAKVMRYVIAANKGASVAQITGATDTALQTNVDAAVDALVAGGITE